jgi:hypothetical protein
MITFMLDTIIVVVFGVIVLVGLALVVPVAEMIGELIGKLAWFIGGVFLFFFLPIVVARNLSEWFWGFPASHVDNSVVTATTVAVLVGLLVVLWLAGIVWREFRPVTAAAQEPAAPPAAASATTASVRPRMGPGLAALLGEAPRRDNEMG